ncbi:hypothetical protein D3C72_2044690 [compost metagenome]
MIQQAVGDRELAQGTGVVVGDPIGRGQDLGCLQEDGDAVGEELEADTIEKLPVLTAQQAQQALVGEIGAVVSELVLGLVAHAGLAELRAGHPESKASRPRSIPIRILLRAERERDVSGTGFDHGRSSSLRRTAARG